MESLFTFYLIVWKPLGYLLAFLGSAFEGDLIWFAFSFFTSLGFFEFWPMVVAVFAGAIAGDLFFYFLGTRLEVLPPRFKIKLDELSSSIDSHIKKKPLRTLFLSKFVYGIHRALLVRYGMLKVPISSFLKADCLAVATWMTIVGSIGYFSGASFSLLKQYMKYAEVGLLIGLVLIFILIRWINKKAKKEI